MFQGTEKYLSPEVHRKTIAAVGKLNIAPLFTLHTTFHPGNLCNRKFGSTTSFP
jgi:hypothetical protein